MNASSGHFHRDARVIAARKQYRADLKAGMAEREAWKRANSVYAAVRAEGALEVARALVEQNVDVRNAHAEVTFNVLEQARDVISIEPRSHELSIECWCGPETGTPTNRCYVLFVDGNWDKCCEQRPCVEWGAP